MAKTFFITTAIDYTNSAPHIGHAYEKILADVIARYHRLKGENVFFLTGVDQHGQKVQQSAEREGVPPEQFEEVLAAGAAWSVLLAQVGGQLRRDEDTVAEAVRALDERFISPALLALRRGALSGLSVIINDTCVQVRRASLHRFWRRGRSGLAAFA